MQTVADELIRSLGIDEIERIELGERPERRGEIPPSVSMGYIGSDLRREHPDGTLWRHQALALGMLSVEKNVVIATGTGSGKSLIFQYRALELIKRDADARILVFYPLKSLAADQFERWIGMCKRFGLSADHVAKIDGDVPTYERDAILEKSNIVIMTPDVCQAWFMRNVGSTSSRRFLSKLKLIILDEAHVYESVFGSNVAFLLRRLNSVKQNVSKALSAPPELQIIAATATIADPAEHLNRLTGLSFDVIDESENGAPQRARLLLHVGGAEYGAAGERALTDIVGGILRLRERRRFIAFIDSRQGTERVVRDVNFPNVLPYRSGYETADRSSIERALRDGTLNGVVSTSALELGIDIPDMEIGVNLGIPVTRKAFRQRIGRVGRSTPGLFLIIAGPNAFRQYGQTFKEYYNGSVEPSYLYTGNRFIQFAHARCLWDEIEVTRHDRTGLPTGISWPEKFDDVFKYAKPGGGRPREFDYIAQLGADNPHFNYPLRQIGEANYEIRQGKHSDALGKIGNIATNQALREAYPGANYLHFGKSYKILQWIASSFERSIRVEPATKPAPTQAILRKTVNMALDQANIIDGRIMKNRNGLVAEVNLQVNESVEGYRIGSKAYLYRDLRAENPNMSRKQRDIRTTGAVIMINEPWFSGSKGKAPSNREALGRALVGVLSRERSISPQDIDYTSTNIALLSEQGPKRVTNCVAIYDVVYGGIRLTEELVVKFQNYVKLVSKAAELAGTDAIVDAELAQHLEGWASDLESSEIGSSSLPVAPDGWYQVFKPGSVVSTYSNGTLVSRELVAPRLIDLVGDGSKSLFYSYKLNGKQQVIAHDQLQPVGEDWSYVLWNPDTNEFCEPDDYKEDDTELYGQSFHRVYRPGTKILVKYYDRKVEREVISPRIVIDEKDGKPKLEYVYAENGGYGYIPHNQVEPTGSDWSLVLWEPDANTFKEINL